MSAKAGGGVWGGILLAPAALGSSAAPRVLARGHRRKRPFHFFERNSAGVLEMQGAFFCGATPPSSAAGGGHWLSK
jgi:hypothetical protein